MHRGNANLQVCVYAGFDASESVQKAGLSVSLRAKRSNLSLIIIIPGDCFGKNPCNDTIIAFLHKFRSLEFHKDNLKQDLMGYDDTGR